MFKVKSKVVFGQFETIHDDLKDNIWTIEEVYPNHMGLKGNLTYRVKSIQNPDFMGYLTHHDVLRLASKHEISIGRAVRSADKAEIYDTVVEKALKILTNENPDINKVIEMLQESQIKSRVY